MEIGLTFCLLIVTTILMFGAAWHKE